MAAAKAEISLSSGLRYLPGRLAREEQESLVEIIRGVVTDAPLYVPVMPGSGRPMSVRMTNCGPLGWVTDKERGYRYQATHPMTGKRWPAIPDVLLDLWRELSGYPKDPEACLVNFYADDAKMGLHQDRDESEFAAPVLSISLGNTCLFRIGGLARTDRTQSLKLESGDVFLLGGEGRLCFHGVDRIYPGTSTLLKSGGRINLTLRRVNP
ncbi:alpha-ketoglutarate-dependent dioxygenase AlkB family protein [Agrobacterium sp. RAC06]|uniref:alpha-ketoglutarate-dependent dioxygenase AlkB family protein n=1 Tax=Agrobacterium sp. RAC06 TaxID=1842536 RepID=UPI00083DF02F|nr:alpha-ketoglutarate-dependent dioxygenase AlkB [Agrobacterium sp. RAC06]AOG09884.1 2OG-Fe(II) oxygenase superfamily protein [Agrobacterium sp. RAC06]